MSARPGQCYIAGHKPDSNKGYAAGTCQHA
jgi:hypothetical protein